VNITTYNNYNFKITLFKQNKVRHGKGIYITYEKYTAILHLVLLLLQKNKVVRETM